ncbi:hypothetical protein [Leptospira noguchii]|uniref:hypothetical protein n=1 Tax=Leptospira noguchii TaxID=28182 RepID=UPI00056B5D4E|nr:hypothetical protein [Leptospira noguchii]
MNIEIDDELKVIIKESNYHNYWVDRENCDLFQMTHYCGGYDSLENAFSFYDIKNIEYLFQMTLDKILSGEIKQIKSD